MGKDLLWLPFSQVIGTSHFLQLLSDSLSLPAIPQRPLYYQDLSGMQGRPERGLVLKPKGCEMKEGKGFLIVPLKEHSDIHPILQIWGGLEGK